MKFSATPDKSLQIATAIVSLLFLGSIGFCLRLFIVDKAIISLVIAVLLLAVFLLAYLYAPQHYMIVDNQLIIKRKIGAIVVPKSAVESVKIIHRDMINGSIRTFGVGGLFGYYGKFSNSKLGAMTWYIKRMDQLVLVTTSTGKIVVSPDDAEGFVKALS